MPADPDTTSPTRRAGWDALAVCGALALAAAVVAGLAWTRPSVTTSTLSYTQSGRLSYGAPVPPTSIYGSTRVATGQPVYTNVVSTLTIGYRYRLHATGPVNLGGTEQLVATVSNGQGITRSVPLQPPTPFKGTHFETTGDLNLPALQAIASEFDGAAAGRGTYDVSISPNVKVKGSVANVPLKATFDQPVKFSLSSAALMPGAASPGTAASAISTGAAVNGRGSGKSAHRFAATASGSVASPQGQPAILFLGLTVSNLRVISLLVLAIALAGGTFVGWPLLRDATSEDERRRIIARHGPSLIEVGALPAGPGVNVVEVASFEGLLQVAQRTECPLLHADLHAAGHVYGVVDNGTVYRYGERPLQPTVVPPLVAANGNGKRAHLVDERGGQGWVPR